MTKEKSKKPNKTNHPTFDQEKDYIKIQINVANELLSIVRKYIENVEKVVGPIEDNPEEYGWDLRYNLDEAVYNIGEVENCLFWFWMRIE